MNEEEDGDRQEAVVILLCLLVRGGGVASLVLRVLSHRTILAEMRHAVEGLDQRRWMIREISRHVHLTGEDIKLRGREGYECQQQQQQGGRALEL